MDAQSYESELKTLTNRQLREKCLFYGLQNVPITKDTRHIIIKKLLDCFCKEQERRSALKQRQATLYPSYRSLKTLNKNIEKFSITNKRMNSAKILGANVLQRLRVEFDKHQNKKRWTAKNSTLDCIQEEFADDTKLSPSPCSSPESLSAELIYNHPKKRIKPDLIPKDSPLDLFGNPSIKDRTINIEMCFDFSEKKEKVRGKDDESRLHYISKNRALL